MTLRQTLEEVAANLAMGFSDEIDRALKADLAMVGSRPALQDAGAQIAAAFLGRSPVLTEPIVNHGAIPPADRVLNTIRRPQVIEIEPLRRLS